MNQEVRDPFLEGNEIIEEAISTFHADQSNENLISVLESIRTRMHADGHFVIPVVTHNGAEMTYSFRGINTNDGKVWNVVFTSQKEFEKGQPSQVISHFIDAALKAAGIMIHRYTNKNHKPRGVFCAIGRCTDCVMIVNGEPNVRTCITPLEEGMDVKTQYGVQDREDSSWAQEVAQ